MIARLLSVVLFCIGIWCINADAQVKWEKFMCCGGTGGGGFVGSCSPSTTFVNRTSGESAGTKTALDTFICGLVTDSLFTNVSSGYCTTNFDGLWILAQDNSGDALLNVCSSSFTLTANGSPAFSADNGYTGVDDSTTVFLDPGYNPSTNGVNFTLNSAHLSVWSATANNNASGNGGAAMSVYDGTNIIRITMYNNATNLLFGEVNDACCTVGGGPFTAIGMALANRSSSLSGGEIVYFNAVDTAIGGAASNAIPNGNIHILGTNDIGVSKAGDGNRLSFATIGGSLTGTQVTNLCHRMNTYLNTVNGTSAGIC